MVVSGQEQKPARGGQELKPGDGGATCGLKVRRAPIPRRDWGTRGLNSGGK